MNNKKFVSPLEHLGKSIEYTPSLFRNIYNTFHALKLKDVQIAKLTSIPLQTLKDLKKEDASFTNSSKLFIFNAFIVLTKAYPEKVTFNLEQCKFHVAVYPEEPQFKDGTYFVYFKNPEVDGIVHFVLIINKFSVDMWSRPKIASGKLIIDRNTYSIILNSRQNRENYEFYMGRKGDNPNLKYFVALWRNSDNDVNCGVCMAKWVGKKYMTVEAIEKVRYTIKHEMDNAMPIFAEDFFEKEGRKIIKFNITNYEYE